MGNFSSVSDFQNYEAIIHQFQPLINKYAYRFYQRYRSVLDYDDSKQEVYLCLLKCLKSYNVNKGPFVGYFAKAFNNIRSKYYYDKMSQINVSQNRLNFEITEFEGSKVDPNSYMRSDCSCYMEEDPKKDSKIRLCLSHKGRQIYDIFVREGKINKYMLHINLGIPRSKVTKAYNIFTEEVKRVCELV